MNTAYNLLKDFIPVHNALKTREDGNFLIASNRNSEIYYFNGMAKDIWNKLDGMTSVEVLCMKILSEYRVERGILERDIVNLIRDLQWKKLILMKSGGTNHERI